MKKSLKIVDNNPFPIQVTGAFPEAELQTWINDFKKKNIATILKTHQTLKKHTKAFYKREPIFTLHRAVTAEEIAEIKAGKVLIQGGSFWETRNTAP